LVELVSALPRPTDLAVGRVHHFGLLVGPGAESFEIVVPLTVIVGASPGPTLLVVAGVHGDEYDGILATLGLSAELDPRSVRGRVLLVPTANPLAFRAGTRQTPSDGKDMNRVFPGDPEGSATDRLADLLMNRIVVHADFTLTMHGWLASGITLPFVEYPRECAMTPQCREAACALGLPYIEGLGRHPEGRFMSAAVAVGHPTVESEVGGEGTTTPERRQLCRSAVTNLLGHLEMTDEEPHPIFSKSIVRRIEISATASGALDTTVGLGEPVAASTAIARIRKMNGEILTTLTTSTAGIIGMIRTTGVVEAGDAVAHVFVTDEATNLRV
jgi:predicted deacylase